MLDTGHSTNSSRSVSFSVVLLLATASCAAVLSLPSIAGVRAEALSSWAATTSYPTSTGGPSCTPSGGFVYCVGDGTDAVYYASLSPFGIGAWKATTDYPSSISAVACSASTSYLYCVAGINGSLGPRPTTQVFYAQLSASGGLVGGWQKTTNYPQETIGPSCVIWSSDIYCVGGSLTVGTLQTNGAYYAPISSSGVGAWETGTTYPQTDNGLSCVTSDGYIYCFGGFTALGPRPINATYSAPLSASGFGSWSAGTIYPTTDYGQSCVAISGYAYCVGGLTSGGVQRNAVYYSPISGGSIGAWTSTAPYPTDIDGESCVTSGSTIACIAGTSQGGSVSGDTGAAYYTSVSPQNTDQLTVSSQSTSGQTLTGYYTALNQSGSVVESGFTPYTFALNSGQTYTVQVDNYGSCTFAYWEDTGSTQSSRSVSITTNTEYTAVYNCGGGSTGGSSSVTVDTVNQDGTAITGYYVALYGADGDYLTSGYSPATFSTTAGEGYQVAADGYGSCTFSRWSNGSGDPLSFTATSSAQTFTAIYTCGTSTSGGAPSSGGTSSIDVSTVNSAGSPISGYYISLWQDGAQINSCFSACSFTVNNGQTYQVAASAYGSETFSHWQNDGSKGFETVTPPSTSTTLSLTAVYNP